MFFSVSKKKKQASKRTFWGRGQKNRTKKSGEKGQSEQKGVRIKTGDSPFADEKRAKFHQTHRPWKRKKRGKTRGVWFFVGKKSKQEERGEKRVTCHRQGKEEINVALCGQDTQSWKVFGKKTTNLGPKKTNNTANHCEGRHPRRMSESLATKLAKKEREGGGKKKKKTKKKRLGKNPSKKKRKKTWLGGWGGKAGRGGGT